MAAKGKKFDGPDRRRAPRRRVIERFSFSLVVPGKGVHRLPIHDLSKGGLSFDLDLEGEAIESFQPKQGDELEVFFYLNLTLYVPLEVKVAWIKEANGVRTVGIEFADRESAGARALSHFMDSLDSIAEALRIGS